MSIGICYQREPSMLHREWIVGACQRARSVVCSSRDLPCTRPLGFVTNGPNPCGENPDGRSPIYVIPIQSDACGLQTHTPKHADCKSA